MKLIYSSSLIVFVALALFSCNAQTSNDPKAESVTGEELQVSFNNTEGRSLVPYWC